MKYKIGDIVEIVLEKPRDYIDWWADNGQMDKYLGTAMTIKDIDVDEHCYKMYEDYGENGGDGWFWYEHMVEGLHKEFDPIKKESLMSILTEVR